MRIAILGLLGGAFRESDAEPGDAAEYQAFRAASQQQHRVCHVVRKYPNGDPKALHSFLNARLNGPSFLIAEDGNGRWAADYYQGDRHGSFRVWDDNGKMALS